MSYIDIFKQNVENTFNEWVTQGACVKAAELNDIIAKHSKDTNYFNKSEPQFFFGDLQASLVLVHLNPKTDKINVKTNEVIYDRSFSDYSDRYTNFEKYFAYYEKFGEEHYGGGVNKTGKDIRFDAKQVRFLKPFNVIDFIEGETISNLEKVMDKKLQLELIPFGSPNFDYNVIGIENIKPFIDNIIHVISAVPRKYVIFCGRVFCHLLKDYIVWQEIKQFKLKKVDGSMTKGNYELIRIILKIPGTETEIKACIAPQFATQGLPMSEYGEMIAANY